MKNSWCDLRRAITIPRVLTFVIGINVLAIGTVLFTTCQLGVSALVSVPQTLSLLLPMTLGQATTMMFIIYVSAQFVIYRKLRLKVAMQFPLAFVFGWLVDFYNLQVHFNDLRPENVVWKILLLLLAAVATSVGIFMMVQANYLLIPPDGLVGAFSWLLKWPFGTTKFAFDLFMVVVSSIISIVGLGYISSIGIGTLFAVLSVGRMVNLWGKVLVRIRRVQPGMPKN